MLLLGIDIGTSSIKVSVVDAQKQQCIASAHYPETETGIESPAPGWAEQSPDDWWENVQQAILKLNAQKKYDPRNISAIGIAYQMHGLVMADKDQTSLRNSIIWCDSRSVDIGEQAFETIGKEKCLGHLLNSPGNFTASKLAWVKQNQPDLFQRIDKIMLPGDFIAMKLTGNCSTTISALSEGIFWDFKNNQLSKDVFEYFGFSTSIIPEIKDVFSEHGSLSATIATGLSLKAGIPISYKAGDQPNNALALNVLKPGEVAATAGTSGVIYAVTDKLAYDKESRVNSFAHVNYKLSTDPRIGVLLCINGTGVLNRWVRDIAGAGRDYEQLNKAASAIRPGSEGIKVFPFGNGAERILNNKSPGAQITGLDLNLHKTAHVYRAAQEGIAYAFRYGFGIMKENGIHAHVIRAGRANMFQSDVFTACFVNNLDIPVELYEVDGSVGAAIGAGLGAKIYTCPEEAFRNFKPSRIVGPDGKKQYDAFYQEWEHELKKQLN